MMKTKICDHCGVKNFYEEETASSDDPYFCSVECRTLNEQKVYLLDVRNHSAYDIACALRGPDFTEEKWAEDLKLLTTAVLRHLLGVKNDLAYTMSPEEAKVNWNSFIVEKKRAIAFLLNKKGHFSAHLESAATHLPAFQEYMRWFYDETWKARTGAALIQRKETPDAQS